jgi:hypothetical protein
MKIILSKILYYLGDFISKLLYYTPISKLFARILYPMYNKLMIWSSELDKDGAIWKNVKDE